MQIRTKQYLIVVFFSVLSVFVYKYGVNIDHGTVNVSANVSNFNYSIGRSDFECATNRCSQIIKPNSYTLTVSKDDFLPFSSEIKVSQQQLLDIEVNLERFPTVKELTQDQFTPVLFIQDGFLWQKDGQSNKKILALDTSRVLSDFSYDSSSSAAFLIYDQKDIYNYKLGENQSNKLQLPLDFEPKQIQGFSNSTTLVSNTDNEVFQLDLSTQPIKLVAIPKIESVKHVLPLKNGYLAILPSNLEDGDFNLSNLLINGIEGADGTVTSEGIKSQYDNLDKALFYYSETTKSSTKILEIGSTKDVEVNLSSGIVGQNSSPILKARNTFYEIEL